MFHAFVLAGADPVPLARTLAALVPAAVLGHLGRVGVLADAPDEDMRRLVDAAGCDLPDESGIDAAMSAARRSGSGWLLLCRAGQAPVDGWSELVARHVATGGGRTGVILPGRGAGRQAAARFCAAAGFLSTRRHMLAVAPASEIRRRPGAFELRGGATLLRTVFDE